MLILQTINNNNSNQVDLFMDRFARNFNLSSGAAAIVVACFLTVPCHKATAETPSAVQAEVTAQQNIDIKGRIVDQNGQPVIGASLFQQGTNNGTVADVDGRFSINVPNGASLKVSCLGYQDVIVTARNGMTIMKTTRSSPRLWWSATELRKEPTSPVRSPRSMSERLWKAVLSPMSAVDFRVLSRE